MFLDLLLPQRCVACRAPGAQLCAACVERLPRLAPPLCARCGKPTAWPVERCVECAGRRLSFARARQAVAYDDDVRAIVHAWKERGLRRLAAVAVDLVAAAVEPPDAALTFVAPDRERRRARGDHPAEALANGLAERWGVPVLALLERRRGRRQRGLPLDERRRNVRGSFSARPAPARVVLVDDVYTSGATTDAAASALRRAGAREVDVVTFARAMRGYTVRSHG